MGASPLGIAPLALALLACGGGAGPPEPPGPVTVRAGAPGEESEVLSSRELASLSGPEHTEADVRFMRMMIPHHAQALDMTDLVESRTSDEGLRQLALRMQISQRDEIALMERWLESRGGPGMEHEDGHGLMPGMLTPGQMQELASAHDDMFDQLFLTYMIQHHEGALTMVADLFATRGGGQASEVFQFANDVDVDQRMEIARMRRMLEERR